LIGSIELLSYIPHTKSKAEICECIFPALQIAQVDGDSDFFSSWAILAIHNDDLDQFNKPLLDMIPSNLYTLYVVDSIQLNNITNSYKEFSQEFLQTITLPGMPPLIL
jgi:hypothetical protein